MIGDNARHYMDLLKAAVARCSAIDPEDRLTLPVKRFHGRTDDWVAVRGTDREGSLFGNDPKAGVPFQLLDGGSLAIWVRVRTSGSGVKVVAYSFALQSLSTNPNGLDCLRYDMPEGQPRGLGWDAELKDNPQHPHAHLHLNFMEPDGNDLRLPTGPVCPLLFLRAFDYWYCSMLPRSS